MVFKLITLSSRYPNQASQAPQCPCFITLCFLAYLCIELEH